MSSQPSWRPNVPESQLFGERTFLQGAIISAVFYGVNLALFTLIVSLLSIRLKVDKKYNGKASRQTICLLTYVCAMFILSTLAVASQAEMTQLSFIDNRDFPGGPAAYQASMISIPISKLQNFCGCMMNWFSDGLLLWRCLVVYRSSRTSVWLVMAIPGLMLLGSFVTGTLFLETIFRTSPTHWTKIGNKFQLIYAIITISLNIILTLMIVIRLYLHRRRLTKLLGHRHAIHYTSIISMLIESAAILIVMAFWFLIAFAMGNNQLAKIPLLSLVQVQAAASYMIIFRVAQGIAWTSRTAADSGFTIEKVGGISSIRFQTASESDSESVKHPTDSPVSEGAAEKDAF